MKASELRAKSPEDLGRELLALRREAFNLRMQAGSGEMARPHQMKRIRRDIARIKTVLGERDSGQADA